MQVDPLHHPDLTRLGRRMRDQLDETLEAEQAAALAAYHRRRSLRDLLLEAEDRGATAVVTLPTGQLIRGQVRAVGVDHVIVADEDAERAVALDHLVLLEVR